MIRTRLADGFLLTTQIDHAAFAADLAALWRADGLPENPRRKTLLRAIRHHDDGWAGADSAPRVQADGSPHHFMSLAVPDRLEIWNESIDRWASRSPEVAVYIVRHALEIHRRRSGPGWDEAKARWAAIEDEVRAACGLSEDDLLADYEFLRHADNVSLAACARWTEPETLHGLRMQAVVDAVDPLRVDLRLDPLPLAGATTFDLRCRVVPERTYRGDTDLAVELMSASWQVVKVRVTAFP